MRYRFKYNNVLGLELESSVCVWGFSGVVGIGVFLARGTRVLAVLGELGRGWGLLIPNSLMDIEVPEAN